MRKKKNKPKQMRSTDALAEVERCLFKDLSEMLRHYETEPLDVHTDKIAPTDKNKMRTNLKRL